MSKIVTFSRDGKASQSSRYELLLVKEILRERMAGLGGPEGPGVFSSLAADDKVEL